MFLQTILAWFLFTCVERMESFNVDAADAAIPTIKITMLHNYMVQLHTTVHFIRNQP